MKKVIIAIILVAAITNLSQAQTRTPRARHRANEQQERIAQGVASGELNRREAGKLEAEQAQTHQAVQNAKVDGQVTPRERARIEHLQDRNSKDIYREKHDRNRKRG